MEETNGDSNSDSDSVNSWTIVDKKMNVEGGGSETEHQDKPKSNIREIDDTDTDGISVISEEELENSDDVSRSTLKTEADVTVSYQDEKIDIPNTEVKYPLPNFTKKDSDSDTNGMQGFQEELCDEYFNEAKVRSYIHKRNNKLSGILNMILLGTIVTTACLAIGHMWGTTDDCSPDMFSSVSQLTYTMQELQHENHVLKSKLKVLESKHSRLNQLSLILYRLNSYDKPKDEDKSACNCLRENNTDTFDFKNILNAQLNDSVEDITYDPVELTERPQEVLEKDPVKDEEYYMDNIIQFEQPQTPEKPKHLHKRDAPVYQEKKTARRETPEKRPIREIPREYYEFDFEKFPKVGHYDYEIGNQQAWRKDRKKEVRNANYSGKWKENKENIPQHKYKNKDKKYKEYQKKEKEVKNSKHKQKQKYQEYNKKGDYKKNFNSDKKEKRIFNV